MDPSPLRPRRVGAALVAMGAFWLTAAAYVVHPALPHNPVRLPFASSLRTQLVAPQGWAFFTRDPREPQARVFARTPAGWRAADDRVQADADFAFGLDRAARARHSEIGLLLHGLGAHEWTPCGERTDGGCLDAAPSAGEVDNPVRRPTLCGRVGLLRRPPVPWAWSRSPRPVRMPAEAITLEVRC